MMQKPILYLMVGLPGAGKTARAKEIETQHAALRLTADEWILTLYGSDLERPERDDVRVPVQIIQWQVAKRMLELGCNVILDWGFWSRSERAAYREEAESLGALVEIIFLDAPLNELWERISQRDESKG